MLNYLWAAMIVIGIVYGALTGNMSAVGNGALDSAKDAVSLCITMLGVMSLWTGLMQIAQSSGLINKCMHMLEPIMRWLFPDVPPQHKAMDYMTTNVIAHLRGLGWAATPAGIKAMEELAVLEDEECQNIAGKGAHREHVNKERWSCGKVRAASNAMCTFLVINISSLQLIPVNIIAYRSQYGSVNPTSIVAPGFLATLCSTVVAIMFCKIMCKRRP